MALQSLSSLIGRWWDRFIYASGIIGLGGIVEDLTWWAQMAQKLYGFLGQHWASMLPLACAVFGYLSAALDWFQGLYRPIIDLIPFLADLPDAWKDWIFVFSFFAIAAARTGTIVVVAYLFSFIVWTLNLPVLLAHRVARLTFFLCTTTRNLYFPGQKGFFQVLAADRLRRQIKYQKGRRRRKLKRLHADAEETGSSGLNIDGSSIPHGIFEGNEADYEKWKTEDLKRITARIDHDGKRLAAMRASNGAAFERSLMAMQNAPDPDWEPSLYLDTDELRRGQMRALRLGVITTCIAASLVIVDVVLKRTLDWSANIDPTCAPRPAVMPTSTGQEAPWGQK